MFKFCVQNNWVVAISLFAERIRLGSRFYLCDLPMNMVVEMVKLLLNTFFHLSYVWVLVFIVAGIVYHGLQGMKERCRERRSAHMP